MRARSICIYAASACRKCRCRHVTRIHQLRRTIEDRRALPPPTRYASKDSPNLRPREDLRKDTGSSARCERRPPSSAHLRPCVTHKYVYVPHRTAPHRAPISGYSWRTTSANTRHVLTARTGTPASSRRNSLEDAVGRRCGRARRIALSRVADAFGKTPPPGASDGM